jgi:hypothetical protein
MSLDVTLMCNCQSHIHKTTTNPRPKMGPLWPYGACLVFGFVLVEILQFKVQLKQSMSLDVTLFCKCQCLIYKATTSPNPKMGPLWP